MNASTMTVTTRYHELAAAGLRMPIGTHLVLSEQDQPDQCLRSPERLGEVFKETARRYRTPLAFPLMDLMIEKQDLLTLLGMDDVNADTFHFTEKPSESAVSRLENGLEGPLHPQLDIYAGAIANTADDGELLPMGMAIGPFSLATKLLSDPITAVYLAGAGFTEEDEPDVGLFETCLTLGLKVILRSIRAQVRAGARAVCLCEPAANKVYLSPQQMADGADVFDRFVLEPNRAVRSLLRESGADLVFHDCGELTDDMLRAIAGLEPEVLSLGSSVDLTQAAAIVPASTVLFGNLPSKQFYSDAIMPVDKVREMSRGLLDRMEQAGRPFILGTECDVLHVEGADRTIRAKVDAMMTA